MLAHASPTPAVAGGTTYPTASPRPGPSVRVYSVPEYSETSSFSSCGASVNDDDTNASFEDMSPNPFHGEQNDSASELANTLAMAQLKSCDHFTQNGDPLAMSQGNEKDLSKAIFRHSSSPARTSLRRTSPPKKKTALGWSGFNKGITDNYLNVDGTTISESSPCVGREQKELMVAAKQRHTKEALQGMSLEQLTALSSHLVLLVGAATEDLNDSKKDGRLLKTENEALCQRMAEACDRINEQTLQTAQACLARSASPTVDPVGMKASF